MKKIILPEKIFGVDSNVLMIWVVPGFWVMVFLVTVVLVVVPKIKDFKPITDEIKKVQKSTKEVNEKRSYFMSVDQEELMANSRLLNSGVLPEKNAYLLIKVIQSVAANSNFNISDFSISLGDVKEEEEKEKVTVDYEKVPVDLILSGPKDKYLELVAKLERTLPILSLETFEMVDTEQTVEIELTVSAFYLPESKKVNIEKLSLSDVTLKQEEADLLSKIREYQAAETRSMTESGAEFKVYERVDPFFTP